MENLEKKIINKIDSMKDEIIKFYQQIIQIPSENPPRKYKEISKFIENKMNYKLYLYNYYKFQNFNLIKIDNHQ